MSDSLNYDVMATLRVAGVDQANAGLMRAAQSADALQKSFNNVTGGARQMVGGFMDVASSAVAMTAKMAGVAAAATAAATGAAVGYIGKNMAELEDKSIQLTAVVAAATQQQFGTVRGETSKLFEQFRSDALTSAGETRDFVNTASMIAGPLLGAGKSMSDLRDITKGVMATAPALGASFEQAGSDVMRMFQGHAGSELPFFRALQSIPSLGIKSAEEFNKIGLDKRIDLVRKALANPAFIAASEEAGKSLTGLLSTSQDLFKTAGGMVLGPVFERGKQALADFTQATIASLGPGGRGRDALTSWGVTLGLQFNDMRDAVQRVFPDMDGSIAGVIATLERLTTAGLNPLIAGVNTVADHWPEIVAGAKSFAGHIEHAAEQAGRLLTALGGGDMMKGLERAGLLVAGGKVASPLASSAGGAVQMAGGLLSGGKALLGTEAAGGVAEAGAAAVAGAGGAAAVGAIAAGVAAFAATAYLAIESDTFGFFEHLQKRFESITKVGQLLWSSLGKLWDSMGNLWAQVKPVAEVLANLYMTPLVAGLEALLAVIEVGAHILNGLVLTLGDINDGWTEMFGLLKNALQHFHLLKDQPDEKPIRQAYDVGVNQGAPVVSIAPRAGADPGEKKKDPPPQKVEVTLKWDFGQGDDDALMFRTRKGFMDALRDAKSSARPMPMPGRP